MKKIYKILTFAVALTLTFVLAGCGKTPDPVEQDLTTAEVATLFSELIDLNDFNFTATASANYEISKQEGTNTRQSEGNNFQNIVLKIDGANGYISVPNVIESYQYDNWVFEREFGEEFNIDFDNTLSNPIEMLLQYAPQFETMIQENLANLFDFDESWLSSTKLSSGAYKLTLNPNLKTNMTSLQDVLVDYSETPLQELLDAVLQIHYGEDFNLASVITNLKAEITITSTLGDVLNFVEEEFDINISNSYAAIRSFMIGMDEETQIPNLTDNFFSLIEIQSNEAFTTLIDGFVSQYLQNENITLSTFLAGENLFAHVLKGFYDFFTTLTINELNFNIDLVTNAQKTQISSIVISASGDITSDNVNMTLDAEASVVFSNIGSTEVSLPELTVEDINEIDLYYDFVGADLTLNTAKVISNVHLGSLSFNFEAFENNASISLVYNATQQTLTLSADSVNYLLQDSNYISFLDEQEICYVAFNYHPQVD